MKQKVKNVWEIVQLVLSSRKCYEEKQLGTYIKIMYYV